MMKAVTALQAAAILTLGVGFYVHVNRTLADVAKAEARNTEIRSEIRSLRKQLADQDPEARIHQLQDATHDLRGRVGEIERRLAQPWYFYPASPYPPYRR